jgi:hypothetical protein
VGDRYVEGIADKPQVLILGAEQDKQLVRFG